MGWARVAIQSGLVNWNVWINRVLTNTSPGCSVQAGLGFQSFVPARVMFGQFEFSKSSTGWDLSPLND